MSYLTLMMLQNIMSSRLSVCGHKQHHIPPGIVSYDNTMQSNAKKMSVLGQTIKVNEFLASSTNFSMFYSGRRCLI